MKISRTKGGYGLALLCLLLLCYNLEQYKLMADTFDHVFYGILAVGAILVGLVALGLANTDSKKRPS